jgi:hypothetical protein
MTVTHPIIRGKMPPEVHAEIERLATTMAKPTPGKIARAINRHPATVKWYMLTHGLIDHAPGRLAQAYNRNGRTVYPYTEEHDRRLLELRTAGKVFREIGETLTAEFGIERDAHSVQVRNVLLSAAPDEPIPPPRQHQVSTTQQE